MNNPFGGPQNIPQPNQMPAGAMPDPMQMIYNQFGGAQNFQQCFNQTQQMVAQRCQELNMNPEQLAQRMLQEGKITPQNYQNAMNAAAPLKSLFGIK